MTVEDCASSAMATARSTKNGGMDRRMSFMPETRTTFRDRVLFRIRMVSAGNYGKDEEGGVIRIIVNADVGDSRFGGSGLGFSGLQVARKMRKECTGDLHADRGTGFEAVGGEKA